MIAKTTITIFEKSSTLHPLNKGKQKLQIAVVESGSI